MITLTRTQRKRIENITCVKNQKSNIKWSVYGNLQSREEQAMPWRGIQHYRVKSKTCPDIDCHITTILCMVLTADLQVTNTTYQVCILIQLLPCVTWKCTNLAMLGSAMNIWCSRQQMRHCTSLKSLSRPPSGSTASMFLLFFCSSFPCFDFSAQGPLMLLSRLSALAPSSCSFEVGRHTSRRIWTAALSCNKINAYEFRTNTTTVKKKKNKDKLSLFQLTSNIQLWSKFVIF